MMRMLMILALAVALGATGGAASADGESPDLVAAKRAAGTVNGLCPVMQKPVTKAGGSAEYRDERIGFCCPPCAEKFRADPVRYLDRMRVNPAKYAYAPTGPTLAAMTKAARAVSSANGLCPVMERLVTPAGGSTTYKEQKIAFCCKGCSAKFEADPERYMRAMRADPKAYGYDRPGPTHAELRVAREAVGSVNGLCPVMGKLVTKQGGAVTYHGERIAFCCPPCAAKFRADPEAYLAKMRQEPAVYGYLPSRPRATR